MIRPYLLASIDKLRAVLARVAYSGSYNDLSNQPVIPSTPVDIGAATVAQGEKADSAVQPGALKAVAFSGDYNDLSNKPTITAQKRILQMNATLGAGNAVTLNFGVTPPFATAPLVIPVTNWVADQAFYAVAGAVTASSVALTGKRSRGTLLLSSGPFEQALSGDTVKVLIIEQ